MKLLRFLMICGLLIFWISCTNQDETLLDGNSTQAEYRNDSDNDSDNDLGVDEGYEDIYDLNYPVEVSNGMLVFQSKEDFVQFRNAIDTPNVSSILNWESEIGFNSLYSLWNEGVSFEDSSDTEDFSVVHSDVFEYESESNMLRFKDYRFSDSRFLNHNGNVIIGNYIVSFRKNESFWLLNGDETEMAGVVDNYYNTGSEPDPDDGVVIHGPSTNDRGGRCADEYFETRAFRMTRFKGINRRVYAWLEFRPEVTYWGLDYNGIPQFLYQVKVSLHTISRKKGLLGYYDYNTTHYHGVDVEMQFFDPNRQLRDFDFGYRLDSQSDRKKHTTTSTFYSVIVPFDQLDDVGVGLKLIHQDAHAYEGTWGSHRGMSGKKAEIKCED